MLPLKKYQLLANATHSWDRQPNPTPISRRGAERELRSMGWTDEEIDALEARGLFLPLASHLVRRGVFINR